MMAPLDEVANHGRDVAVDQLRAVQIGVDGDPFGQHLLDFLHARLQLAGDHVGVGPLEHHGDAADTLALAVARHGAEALGRAELHGAHVAHVNRDAAAVGHHDAADVVERRNHTLGADVVGAVDLLDVAAARVFVVAAQRLEDVADGDVERVEGVGVDGHLILLEVASEAVDFDDSRDARQLALDNPVLDGAQLHGVVALLVARLDVERILVDFAQTRGDGHHLGGAQLGGNLSGDGLYLFVDELPGVENRHALLEDHRDDRQTEARHGANLLDVHDVAHRHLDGEGDELLDLLRSERGGDGHNLHLVVGDVRHGVDRKRHHRIDSSRQQEEGGQSDEEFFRDRKADDGLEHGMRRLIVFCTVFNGTKIARAPRPLDENPPNSPFRGMSGPYGGLNGIRRPLFRQGALPGRHPPRSRAAGHHPAVIFSASGTPGHAELRPDGPSAACAGGKKIPGSFTSPGLSRWGCRATPSAASVVRGRSAATSAASVARGRNATPFPPLQR